MNESNIVKITAYAGSASQNDYEPIKHIKISWLITSIFTK